MYDGILGILVPLEIIRVFKEKSIIPERPIIVANFTNEEGFRFKPLMSGSGVLSGDFDIGDVYKDKDSKGKSFKEELEKIGYLGSEENRLDKAHAFIELHQEQGPILDLEKTPIGVVAGILGLTWLTVTLEGRTDNSGPTPMYARKDTLASAAKMIAFAEGFASEISKNAIVTIGKIINEPNDINAVPGLTQFSLDIRDIDIEARIKGVEKLKEKLKEMAKDYRVKITFELEWEMDATIFSSNLNNIVREAIAYHDYPSREIVSGAGHISTNMNNLCPTAMVFVPSINGVSHSPEEKTNWEDIEKSVHILTYIMKKIAEIK
ncbi:hydantoinase/carbamoylase family amidase [Virgibacillus halophilus]|uniref:hydantoinase/carbamoylase family amidase n=1 Tax=Tigheibacillus halophilus TaxID=361280 RepID=UPI0036303409